MPPSFEVQVSEQFRRQAMAAARYIAGDSPQAAQDLIEHIDQALAGLEQLPQRGALVPEGKRWRAGYRQTFVDSYRVIYRVRGDRVKVLRLTHGAREADPREPK